MTQVVAYLEAIVGADITSFRRGMQEVRRETGILTDDFTGMAGNIAKVGQAMTFAITTPLLAIGGAAVKAASDFDASMHNINSIAHMTGAEFQALNQEVLEFGTNSRSGPQAAADALYEIYSAGLSGAKAMDLMKISTKTAEAGLADLSKTTNALTATVMAYSSQNLSAADASNIWTKMVQVGVGSLDDFLANAQKVLPLGAALGVSFQDVGANAAYLSQQGGGARKAMTAIAMAFSNLLKPNETMIQAFHKLGVATGQDLVKKFGSFEDAIFALKGAVKDPVEFNKMFSKTGLEAVLSMTNNMDALKNSIKSFGTGLDDATNSAWEEQMQSYAAVSDRFKAALDGLMIALGKQLLPIMTSILTPLTGFITKIAGANPQLLQMAVAFGIAATAAGPLLWIISSLFSPIGLLVGAVAAIGVAFATNFGGIRDIVTSAVKAASDALAPFIEVVKAAWEVLSGTGVTLEQGKSINSFIDGLNTQIDTFLNGGLPQVTNTTKELKIPVKAGMTLDQIYYNSEWSKDLQSKFSYTEFLTTATSQIKGGDPRWLQAGQDLVFQIGIQAEATAPEGSTGNVAKIGGKYNLQFLAIKDEIQKQFDFVFKGRPLVNDDGSTVDAAKALPILASLRLIVQETNGILANWKDTAATALKGITDGISGFITGLTSNIDWSTIQSIANKALIVFGVLWLVFSTVIQGLIQVASKVIGSALPELGKVVADFVNLIAHAIDGKDSVGKDLLKIAVDIVAGINTFVNDMTGTTGSFQDKFMALSGAITTAIQLVISAIQGAARDIKLSINQFMIGVFDTLSSVADTLLSAKIITPEQAAVIKLTNKNLKVDTTAADFAKSIEEALKNGGAGIGSLTIDNTDLKTVVKMGSAKQIADQLTVQGQEGLKAAIATALTNNNKDGNLEVLLPIAVAGGLDLTKMDFSKLSPQVKSSIEEALKTTSVDDGTTNTFAAYTSIGENVIKGMTEGMVTATPELQTQATQSAKDLMTQFENDLGIQSPSTWGRGVGMMIPAGMVIGMALGSLALIVASTLMANIGVKIPIKAALSSEWAKSIGRDVANSMAAGMNEGVGSLTGGTNGVIGAMTTMKNVVIGIGNTLANEMQTIVNRLTGQLNALKNAILEAANLKVPTGGGTGGGKPPDERASGGSAQGLTWVGERGPELVDFQQRGTVIPNHAIRNAMTTNVSNSNTSGGNTIIVNGVQDVDKMLFELKRRGIVLA